MSSRMTIALSLLLGGCLILASGVGAEDWTLKGIQASGAPAKQGPDADFYLKKGYKLDRRYHHDRFYPPVGIRYKSLPRDNRRVSFHGLDYFFYGGAWYLMDGPEYLVVAPPVGLSVAFLPPYYTTVWVGSVPYYYAAGTYYTWSPKRRVYIVNNPPPQSEVVEQATVPGRLFIYPKQGQSEQQQAADRYECHCWARDESGFDPTVAGGGVSTEENAQLRAEYNRAMTACLVARGYSVQ
jgi:hypothetical protein